MDSDVETYKHPFTLSLCTALYTVHCTVFLSQWIERLVYVIQSYYCMYGYSWPNSAAKYKGYPFDVTLNIFCIITGNLHACVMKE